MISAREQPGSSLDRKFYEETCSAFLVNNDETDKRNSAEKDSQFTCRVSNKLLQMTRVKFFFKKFNQQIL